MSEPEGAVPGLTGELRALIREVIRDQLGAIGSPGTGSAETVHLSTDDDLAAFVARVLDMSPAEQEALRSGHKRFRLAATPHSPVPAQHSPRPAQRADGANGSPFSLPMDPSGGGPGIPLAPSAPHPPRLVRRVERGAVTEAMVRDAARSGERLVLGPGAVLTPLARDRARTSGVEIEQER